MTDVALQPQQSSIWWVFLLQGLAGIILGLMLLTEPGATMVALTTLLGFYWLIMDLVAPEWHRGNSGRALCSTAPSHCGPDSSHSLCHHPRCPRLVMGVIGIIGGFQGGGVGSFILGVVNVLVGLLLLGSPVAAALAVPLLFGVLLVVQGVASIVLAFRVRA
jgi:uncharacterized membrane protein HdeD (DUF308 family)